MGGPFDHIEEIYITKRFDRIVEVEKFNPYHDRLGRFASASSGGASLAMGVDGRTAGGRRAAVAGSLRDAERKNKDLDHEVATIINPKSGKVIFSKEGGAAGVSFNSSEIREIAGQVVTHNHPDNVIFSPTDVAMSYHVDTIRATNPSGTVYELSKMNRKDAVLAYQQHYMSARAESFKKLGIAEGTRDRDLVGDQRSKSFAHISESCHQWLTENAANYGYKYSKGEIE